METKRVIVLAGYSFPVGLAPTTRIIAYSLGLMENGVQVEVVNYGHVAPNATYYPNSGIADGVPYVYAYKRLGSKNNFRRKTLDNLIARYKTIRLIQKFNKERRVDYILLSFDAVLDIISFVPALYLLKQRLIFIGDEYPIPIRGYLKDAIPAWKRLFYKFMSRFLTGRILMTRNLETYYNAIYSRPTYILSSIINPNRFPVIQSSEIQRQNRICYMGNLELAKDNVDNIIRAFALIQNKFPELTLCIYGPMTTSARLLVDLIDQLGLNERVKFMGQVPYDEVPGILQSALLLVSSQPQTKRAQGGFPTKLGEYLLSGTPTLLTDVGEISQYVGHGREAWLARPCDPSDFADKMIFILSNYEKALDVAEVGRRYVLDNFTAKKVAGGLIEFLNNRK